MSALIISADGGNHHTLAKLLRVVVTNTPIDTAPRTVVLPANDDNENAVLDRGEAASDQSFMIEYRDAKGDLSARRITVSRIAHDPYGKCHLHAFCHERNAMRQFRADRIICAIDYDGVVHDDISQFLSDTFHVRRSRDSQMNGTLDPRREVWTKFVSAVSPEAHVLAALSSADGRKSKFETAVIVNYLSSISNERSVSPEGDFETSITNYVKRLRPCVATIEEASVAVSARTRLDRIGLLKTAVMVMDADGKRTAEELQLLNSVCLAITGNPLSHFSTRRPSSTPSP